jgi:hypothetical protein
MNINSTVDVNIQDSEDLFQEIINIMKSMEASENEIYSILIHLHQSLRIELFEIVSRKFDIKGAILGIKSAGEFLEQIDKTEYADLIKSIVNRYTEEFKIINLSV